MNLLEQLREDPRVTVRRTGNPDPAGKCVVYWMQRAQRALHNPALDVAVAVGNELRLPVVVFFAPIPFYPNANLRHYAFLAGAVPELGERLARRGIGLVFRAYPDHQLFKFCEEVRPALLVGDENPMRVPEQWRATVTRQIRIPFWTVDADVIVPSKLLGREHYAARTIRPHILRLVPQFLERGGIAAADIGAPDIKAKIRWSAPAGLSSIPLDHDLMRDWKIDRSVPAVRSWQGGTAAAMEKLQDFVGKKLRGYIKDRNHPEIDGTSSLSPYLHFGHIGPHTVAAAVSKASAPAAAKQAFLEQLIVRRELSINFVRYSPDYDSIESMEPWAQRSLAEHASDTRAVLYSDSQLENAETHDVLWNAAQKQMVYAGWMHNYLRMYWAKKILEWSPSIAVAYRRAVWLNDRYELDGRDPNGYAGIAWAILGKHDRPWFNRPVFGAIRYMSQQSTSRKFNARQYIASVDALAGGKSPGF
jgi:deoxyribodipyrimidine photo-lyase